jgi:pimeloyl-ACP methyl ester carboxylesterase
MPQVKPVMAEPSPTLVLLPGLDGTEVFFRPLLASLPGWINPRVVCFPQTGPSGYGELLSLVRLAVADIPEFFVLGSSFSGPLAVMLAAAEPEKVRGVILSATFLASPRRDLAWLRFAAIGPVIWTFRAVRRIPVWTLRRRSDPFRRAKAETWSRVPAHALAARLRAVMGVDVRDALRACTLPVLCLTFGGDRTVRRDCGEEILQCCPAARFVTLPGGHFAMVNDPGRSAAEIAGFMLAVQSA